MHQQLILDADFHNDRNDAKIGGRNSMQFLIVINRMDWL